MSQGLQHTSALGPCNWSIMHMCTVPGARCWCHQVHFVSVFEIVKTDHVIVQRTQLDAAHKRSKTQKRRELVNQKTSHFIWEKHWVNDSLVMMDSCERPHPDIRWDATYEEHNVLGVDVEQWVGARSFSFLDELLLICGALAGDGQKDFPMSAQPASRAPRSVRDHLLIYGSIPRPFYSFGKSIEHSNDKFVEIIIVLLWQL